MNKTEQAQQLRLAAELIETGHPLEWQQRDGKWYKCSSDGALNFLTQGFPIRPILATPPDGSPLHNPDNLTAEQVGLGYRLGLQDESASQPHEVWTDGKWRKAFKGDLAFINYIGTYRLPISVPWPEVKADPYAELKAAHAARKKIEAQMPNGEWFDYKPDRPQWNLLPECYRIRPEPPPFQLPPPPPGMRWHREDGWKAEYLPQGYRPVILHEKIKHQTTEYLISNGLWVAQSGDYDISDCHRTSFIRTTRRLIFTHEGKEWTYHRPGDPMPCDGSASIHVLLFDDLACDPALQAKDIRWDAEGAGDIIGWRYAETTKQVELGPEDVPPGSILKANSWASHEWRSVSHVYSDGVLLSNCPATAQWSHLMLEYRINRSIPLTGKWDASAWEPCFKEVQA